VYWPLVGSMDPAPVLGLTAQFTVAAPPLLNVAVNCSTAEPELFVALQPVQLVSMASVPGEIENVLLEELVDGVPPPQPTNRIRAGRPIIARSRDGHALIAWAISASHPARLVRRHAVVCAAVSLKWSGAFLILVIRLLPFRQSCDLAVSAGTSVRVQPDALSPSQCHIRPALDMESCLTRCAHRESNHFRCTQRNATKVLRTVLGTI